MKTGAPRHAAWNSDVGIRILPLNWKRILPAALFLTAAAVFAALNPRLFRAVETRAFLADGFFWAYLLLALAGTFLFLAEIGLPAAVRRGIGWGMVLLAPVGAFYAVDMINSTNVLTFPFQKRLANYLCYLLVFALLYAVSRRAWVTVLAGGGIFLLFGIVNYYVVRFRGEPILPWDLTAVFTAAQVSGSYRYAPTRPMTLAVLGLAVSALAAYRLAPAGRQERPSRRFRLTERLSALLVTGVLLLLLLPADLLSSLGISVWAWNQKVSSERTGVLAGFCANIQFLMVKKPEGYSPGTVEELERQMRDVPESAPLGEPGEQLPTVIVVMNESFADLESAGSLEFAPDPLAYFHSLQGAENMIWGTAYSSAYGGNTCNSEYEFLTGNSMAFLPSGSKPYQQYVDAPQTALPALMKSYGYRCTAIHPGERSAWQRDTAYPCLGFDEFIAAEDFTVSKEMLHWYTTDLSTYHQIVYQYLQGKRQGEPQFLFSVTIQNHGGFEDESVETTVQVKDHEGEWPRAEQYLSLAKSSDEDLRFLLDYFSRQEDPVVILFFGDHWPSLEKSFVSQLLNADLSDPALEDLMREYQVPFVLWANYPLQAQEWEPISLNYLSGLLLRAAGLEGTPYLKYLEQLRQELPVITPIGVMDREGGLYGAGEETSRDELLSQYSIVQYNNSFDEENKVRSFFTREGGS